jgi:hypothetical protein
MQHVRGVLLDVTFRPKALVRRARAAAGVVHTFGKAGRESPLRKMRMAMQIAKVTLARSLLSRQAKHDMNGKVLVDERPLHLSPPGNGSPTLPISCRRGLDDDPCQLGR